MPVYDYLCESCGPFTDMHPMSDCEKPQPCPDCGEMARRAILTAPNFFSMSSERRLAHTTNERSANEPRLMSKGAHPSGCSCCSSGKKSGRFVKYGKNGSKSFPTSRPWMISH